MPDWRSESLSAELPAGFMTSEATPDLLQDKDPTNHSANRQHENPMVSHAYIVTAQASKTYEALPAAGKALQHYKV